MMAMLTLAADDMVSVLLPAQGAAFARLDWRGHAVLVPTPLATPAANARSGAFWMIPWANRLRGGRLGQHGSFPVNRPDQDAAIHGLARDHAFRVLDSSPRHAVMEQRLWRDPVRYACRITVRLGDGACRIQVALTNAGEVPVPMGFGWHPWFPCTDATRVAFAAGTRFASDPHNFADAPEPSTGVDGTIAELIGRDTAYAGWGGAATIAWPGVGALTMAAEGAWARNIHLFTPRGQPFFCLEPVTHVTDVANRREFAAYGDMAMPAPGAAVEAALTLRMA
jgi:aldose 1-epimerase